MAIADFLVPETPQQPQDTDTATVEFFFVRFGLLGPTFIHIFYNTETLIP